MTKTIRMPQALLALWLDGLRSGEYTQAKGCMFDKESGGYCCLGVLAKVAGGDQHEMQRGTPSPKFLEAHGINFVTRVERGLAPPLSGDDGNPFLPKLDQFAALANDAGVPFSEIADAIEDCAEGY